MLEYYSTRSVLLKYDIAPNTANLYDFYAQLSIA